MKNFQCNKHTPNEITAAGYQLQYAMNQYKEAIEKEYGPNPNIWLTNDETGETIFLADEDTAKRIKDRFTVKKLEIVEIVEVEDETTK